MVLPLPPIGKIDIADYGLIDFNFPLASTGWFNGDFNYDGKIDVLDYGIIDFNIGIQGAPFSTTGEASASAVAAVAVPEPGVAAAVLNTLALTWIAVPRRRRRDRHL